MKVVLIGGGVISGKLASATQISDQTVTFSIRELLNDSGAWSSLVNECESADMIVYLAYHHRNLPFNILTLARLLRYLKGKSWRGRFVFFNTQSILFNKIMKGLLPLPAILSCDLYTTTKKIQAKIISIYSDTIDISEIFLPVVVGDGTQWQDRFRFIASHQIIFLPMTGEHVFAYLDLGGFVEWFWRVYGDSRTARKANRSLDRVFVYQGVSTFSEVLRKEHGALTTAPFDIRNCVHKSRFGGNMRSDIACMLKMSPLGLLLGVIRGALAKSQSSGVSKQPSPPVKILPVIHGEQFVPTGSEYQFYGSSLDLSSVPFRAVKID